MEPEKGPVFLAQGHEMPGGVDGLLERAGIEYLSSADLAGALPRQLQSVLDRCTAVVAFVASARPPVGVTLEIGAGLGRGLPVVLILGPKVRLSALPAAFRELPSMQLPAIDSIAGQDRLRSLIRSARQAIAAGPTIGLPTAPSTKVEREKWADESERRVAEALKTLGARIVGYEPANRRGRPDLAALMPNLPGAPFNPVLVEVTGRRPDVRAKESQLRSYMHQADALIGLLVLQDDAAPLWNVQQSGAVLIVGVEHLEQLEAYELVELLREGRNRLFHAS